MRIVALADLHVGGRAALAAPEVSCINDMYAPVRAALFENWRAAAEGPWASPDALIVNGDAVEGKNKKKGGIGTWTTDLLEQADHAEELIRMWKAKRVYIIRGSGYHVDADGLPVEEYMARRLGAEEYPNQRHIPKEKRQRSGWHWYLRFYDVTFHVSHRISVSRVFHYQSTPTARQMLNAKLNDQLRHGLAKHKVRIVLRAHAHYFNTVGYSGSDGFVMPCWKAQDDYMLEKGPLDISPDMGFLGFEVEGENYRYEKNLFELSDVQAPPLSVVRRDDQASEKGDRARAERDI